MTIKLSQATAAWLSATILAGCTPPDVQKPAAPAGPATQTTAAPQAPEAGMEAFAGCQWGEVKGWGLSIWSFACGPDKSGQHLIADDEVGGFAIISDGLEPQVVIRSFAKPAAATIDAALPAIRAASPGPSTATCILTPAPGDGVRRDGSVYYLTPTGAAKVAWDRTESGQTATEGPDDSSEGGAIDPPCGDLGVQWSGDHVFTLVDGDPTKVVYIDAGSEIQIFDPQTLKSAR